jgi:hypothetical protein
MDGLILALLGLGFCMAERYARQEEAEDTLEEDARWEAQWNE